MTAHEQDDILAWTLFALAWLILAAGIAEQVIQHVREERGRKSRPLPGALGEPIDPDWPGWSELKARMFAEDVLTDIAMLPGGDWRGDL